MTASDTRLLRTLESGESFSADVHRRLGQRASLASVYHRLLRLEARGYVTSVFEGVEVKQHRGLRRRYFSLTAQGRQAIGAM